MPPWTGLLTPETQHNAKAFSSSSGLTCGMSAGGVYGRAGVRTCRTTSSLSVSHSVLKDEIFLSAFFFSFLYSWIASSRRSERCLLALDSSAFST